MNLKHRLLAFLYLFRGSPEKHAYDAIQEAMRTHARYLAEAEYHSVMANFYAGRILEIDPHTGPADAWDFADAMQKRHDQQLDWERERNRSSEAHARVLACEERLNNLKATR
jgi:hypothetical protein